MGDGVKMYSRQTKRSAFVSGAKTAVPIGLAYLAVGFSLGIKYRGVGITPLQTFLHSVTSLASAGEYAALTVMAEDAAYTEIILITIIASARYLLMGCAMTQHLSPRLPYPWRFVIGYAITDEIFAISVAQAGYLNPYFSLGAFAVAIPSWGIGKTLGLILGNALPGLLLEAFSVALYGMFLSIVVNPARKEKAVLICVVSSWILSYAAAKLPLTSDLSEGMRTIILTVLVGSAISLIFPYDFEAEDAALEAEITASGVEETDGSKIRVGTEKTELCANVCSKAAKTAGSSKEEADV